MSKLTMEEFIKRANEKNKHVRNGDIEILGEYNGMYERLEYICHKCNNIQNPVAVSLLLGNGCKTCGQIQSGITQRKSHQDFMEELHKINCNIVPVDTYVTRNTKINFMCHYGHVWDATPAEVLNGAGCPYCSGHRVLVGFNDIASTRPDMLQFLADLNDGHKYTQGSNARIDFKCPSCGSVQNRRIGTVSYKGFHCERCGDGVSYPNKFGRAFFDQILFGKYEAEYHPEWGRPYFYDIYFQLGNKEYIVEWDGRQHFEDKDPFGIPLEKYREVDEIKNKLAYANNIHLIRIDCSKSTCDYIRRNIESSDLNILFDLTQIDWVLCNKNAQKNLVKVACDLWMSGIRSFKELSEKMNLSDCAVRSYINRGVQLGWCDYDSRQWIADQCISMRILDIANKKEYDFKSLGECANGTVGICGHRIAEATIRKYCKKGVPYNGLLFIRI